MNIGRMSFRMKSQPSMMEKSTGNGYHGLNNNEIEALDEFSRENREEIKKIENQRKIEKEKDLAEKSSLFANIKTLKVVEGSKIPVLDDYYNIEADLIAGKEIYKTKISYKANDNDIKSISAVNITGTDEFRCNKDLPKGKHSYFSGTYPNGEDWETYLDKEESQNVIESISNALKEEGTENEYQ